MEALEFMETWQNATMVRIVHFSVGDQTCAVRAREFCSARVLGFGGVRRQDGSGAAGAADADGATAVVLGVQRDLGVL
jgi:hypothetical protein